MTFFHKPAAELSPREALKLMNALGRGAIINVSAHDTRRVDLAVGVGYDADIDSVRRVLEGVVADDPRVLEEPAPNIRMSAMGESSVTWIVRPWVRAGDYWDVHWGMTEEIKRRFDREGISIPFPQRDVHVHHHGDAAWTDPAALNSDAASDLGRR